MAMILVADANDITGYPAAIPGSRGFGIDSRFNEKYDPMVAVNVPVV